MRSLYLLVSASGVFATGGYKIVPVAVFTLGPCQLVTTTRTILGRPFPLRPPQLSTLSLRFTEISLEMLSGT